MDRLALVVEGSTEAEFVKQGLAPYLLSKSVLTAVISLNGRISVTRLGERMADLCPNFDRVTSLVDFYGFQDKGDLTPVELERQVMEKVKSRFSFDLDESLVIPYIQQYEFEGLLFSDARAFNTLPGVTASSVARLTAVRAAFDNPEEINDSRDTAPSKRIAQVITGYNKAANGPAVALEIGLAAIRRECPRFNQWVEQLESLG